ncbi:N/A [soil metagenome]
MQAATMSPMTDEPTTAPPSLTGGAAALDFTTFYEQSYNRLAGALILTLGDRDLGQEAADEAMVRAYQRWTVVQTYDNPGGWAYRVGLNWGRSLHRKLARRLPFHMAQTTDPVEIADPAIATALAALDVRMRSVVVCRLLLDWSVEQTATALNTRPGTVKSRLHRALSILETTLEDTR